MIAQVRVEQVGLVVVKHLQFKCWTPESGLHVADLKPLRSQAV